METKKVKSTESAGFENAEGLFIAAGLSGGGVYGGRLTRQRKTLTVRYRIQQLLILLI